MLRFRRCAEAADKPVADERMRPFETRGERWCGSGVHFPNSRLYREDSQASDDIGEIALCFPDCIAWMTHIASVIAAGLRASS